MTPAGYESRCPCCHEFVDPFEDRVHYAVELRWVDHAGGSSLVEWAGGFFHEWCTLPPGWQRPH